MRPERLAEAFVELADTLVDDFDVVEFLHRLANHCVELLPVDEVGLMLADQRGRLRVMAASSEKARLMELLQLQTDQGPCVLCFQTGLPVTQEDLSIGNRRWPRLTDLAAELGFRSLYVLPMRLRTEIIGVMNLFGAGNPTFGGKEQRIAQAMADVATVGLLQERVIRRRTVLAEQLQTALNTRVVIEQAKGVLAERFTLDMDAAFRTLRDYARSHNQRLTDLARQVIAGGADLSSFAQTARANHPEPGPPRA
jgi:transcriptional regulator with GAF, ATPase, and Fis domain